METDRPLRLAHGATSKACEQVITLPMAAKIVNAGWNDGSMRWRVLPRDPDTLRQATQSFETDSGLLNADCSAMPITIFTADHQRRRRSTAWSPR